MSTIASTGGQYMDSLVQLSQQRRGQVFMELMQIAKDSVVTESSPLKPISSAGPNSVDIYA